jgi:type IV pilus assembly protein PilZ
MMDLRRTSRVPLQTAVEFMSESDDVPVRMGGVARDISLGGIFIETEASCAEGERIVILLTLPEGRREMSIPAIVRWTAKDGMGVQFGLLGARDTHEIATFVAARETGR